MKRYTKKISLCIALALGLGNPAHASLFDDLWYSNNRKSNGSNPSENSQPQAEQKHTQEQSTAAQSNSKSTQESASLLGKQKVNNSGNNSTPQTLTESPRSTHTAEQTAIASAFANYNNKDEKVRTEALNNAAAAIGLQKHHYAGPMAFYQLVLENYAKLAEICANNELLQKTLHDFNATAPWSKGEKQLNSLHDTKTSEESKSNESFEVIQTLTIDQIIDIVWYLYACAVKKGQAFEDGTFTIESKPLFDALMMHLQNPTKGRISSHFKEVGVGQYGIDIPHTHAAALSFPNNKYHILFGDISSDKYIQKTGRFLFFLKPESAGIASATDVVLHSGEYLVSIFRKTAPTSALAWAGFKTDDDPTYAKERVEKAVLEKVKTYANLKNNTTIVSEVERHGIKAFTDFIKNEENQPQDEQQRTALKELMTLINRYDHIELRKGREVILTAQELGITPSRSTMAPLSSTSMTLQTQGLSTVAPKAASTHSTSSTATTKP